MTPTRTFPFKRDLSVSPVMVPAKDTASKVTMGQLPSGVTSFAMVNAYPFFIRLLGSSGTFKPAVEGDGWLVPPGHFGVYSTQSPQFLSCIAVDRPGFPIKDGSGVLLYPNAVLELFYGSGA